MLAIETKVSEASEISLPPTQHDLLKERVAHKR